MWFKNKSKTPKIQKPTDEELEFTVDYANNLLHAILSESGDGVHLLTISATGMEDVPFVYGRTDPELYNYDPLDVVMMRVAMRIHVFKGAVVTLQSFDNLDPKQPTFEALEDEIPNRILGWVIKDLERIPLSSQQIFDYWYSDEDETLQEYLEDKVSYQPVPVNTSDKVLFMDAWDISSS